jgi:hypothetical protein
VEIKMKSETIEIVWSTDGKTVLNFIVNGTPMTKREFSAKVRAEREKIEEEERALDRLFNPPVIDQKAKLRKLEKIYPNQRAPRAKFFTLLEIIRTREKIIKDKHCN